MPWVRLHAVKAYSDMVACLDGRPEARVTFNLVPSLLSQIQDYLQGTSDDFMELSRRPADELSPGEKDFVLTHFFSCHWPTMVEPHQRYSQLLSLRGREFTPSRGLEARSRFTSKDFLDLQVWFNLAWIGFSARQHPLVRGLIQKGRLFTEEEKYELLDFHLELMGQIIPKYRALWGQGRIDISTSPFYHPILPLLVDTDFAARPGRGSALPRHFAHPEDARAQLQKGLDYARETLGQAPQGLWPSEGSVAPELVPIVAETGFSWMASDEAILFHSLGQGGPESLFQPYRVESGDRTVDMVFRHHELSDLIGFVYKGNEPRVAVADFISRLQGIRDTCRGMDRPPLVVVLLDGENPWEYYPDGGEAFLSGLYDGILREPDLKLVTITQFLSEHPPTKVLKRLYSGSWINNDFGIWIGGQEENRAWEALGHARAAVEIAREAGSVSGQALSMAMESIYAAEGSDWFWWYGDQFVTDYAFEFDQLFRTHLQQVYRNLGQAVPSDLLSPIRRPRAAVAAVQPLAFVHPEIDGLLSYYWEWAGAGSLSAVDLGGTMHRGRGALVQICYGFDLDWLYLRLDPQAGAFSEWERDLVLKIVISASGAAVALDLVPALAGGALRWDLQVSKNGVKCVLGETGVKWRVDELAEVAVPFAFLDALPKQDLTFQVDTVQNGLVQERWPREGYVVVNVPDEDFEKKIWLV